MRCLRGRVRRHERNPEDGRHRSREENAAVFALHHAGQDGLGKRERGGDVSLQDGLKFDGRNFHRRFLQVNAGVVRENRNGAKVFLGARDEFFRGVELRDVLRFVAGGVAEFFNRLLEDIFAAAHEHDFGPGGNEAFCHAETQAATAASDERGFADERKWIFHRLIERFLLRQN